MKPNHEPRIYLWLSLLCIGQIVLWTLGPTFLYHTPTHDVTEGIAWGMQWQLGYNKHPPLTAWLCALFTKAGGSIGWPVYLLAQLAVVATYLCVFRLACEYTSKTKALLAVFLLQAIVFYTYRTPNITPDTMSTPFWAWTTLSFYFAFTRNKLRDWVLLGLAIGATIMVKYSAPFLFVPLLIAALATRESRARFLTLGPYVAVLVALILLMPHINWSLKHGFPEVHYIFDSASGGADNSYKIPPFHNVLNKHIGFPLWYSLNEIGSFIGVFVLGWALYFKNMRSKKLFRMDPRVKPEDDGKKYLREDTTATARPTHSPSADVTLGLDPGIQSKRFQQTFLHTITWGPLLLTLLYTVVSGAGADPRWSTPYYSFLGLWFMVFIAGTPSRKQFRATIITCCAVGILIFAGFVFHLLHMPFKHQFYNDTNTPVHAMNHKLNQLWRAHTKAPLRYIAGSHYVVAYLSVYNKHHPKPFMGWTTTQSAWVNPQQLKRAGAMFAWNATPNTTGLPAKIKARYPHAQFLGVFNFAQTTFFKGKALPQPMRKIGFAFLPPITQ